MPMQQKKLIQQAKKIPPFINKWKSLRKCEQGLLHKLRSVIVIVWCVLSSYINCWWYVLTSVQVAGCWALHRVTRRLCQAGSCHATTTAAPAQARLVTRHAASLGGDTRHVPRSRSRVTCRPGQGPPAWRRWATWARSGDTHTLESRCSTCSEYRLWFLRLWPLTFKAFWAKRKDDTLEWFPFSGHHSKGFKSDQIKIIENDNKESNHTIQMKYKESYKAINTWFKLFEVWGQMKLLRHLMLKSVIILYLSCLNCTPLRPTLVVPVCGAAPLLAPGEPHHGPGLHVLLHTAADWDALSHSAFVPLIGTPLWLYWQQPQLRFQFNLVG